MATGGTELNQTLSVVGKLKVFDKDGGQIEFEELYKDQKVIIIFVRVRTCHDPPSPITIVTGHNRTLPLPNPHRNET